MARKFDFYRKGNTVKKRVSGGGVAVRKLRKEPDRKQLDLITAIPLQNDPAILDKKRLEYTRAPSPARHLGDPDAFLITGINYPFKYVHEIENWLATLPGGLDL